MTKKDSDKKYGKTKLTTPKHQMQDPCTFSFVTNTNNDDDTSYDIHHHSPGSIGLGSLGFAMALAFASGSFSTSPCYASGSCCDCMDGGTDWLLLGSLAYQCYFVWTAAKQGLRDFVVRH